ncbi:MAG: ImmA/IrrE family metallo-endopeptidase [Propionibacteriales bacterium]|nr:ImmA/IrrE family metallo-endopeptidase [Propionibacteriales bacterium]
MRYDPAADLADRHPGWVVGLVDLGGLVPEVLCWVRRVILIEAGSSPEVQRSSLAHAVAHLDLGHRRTVAGFFENREELQADHLAARRLIEVDQLADALRWSQDRGEVALQLGVDLATLQTREAGLTPAERRRLRGVRRLVAATA